MTSEAKELIETQPKFDTPDLRQDTTGKKKKKLHLFAYISINQKFEHWIKPGSKFLFHFVDILELKVLKRGFWIYLFLSHNKSENTVSVSTQQ